MIKTWGNPGTDFGDYINSGQALGMITAIFISVGIAFVFGTLCDVHNAFAFYIQI